MTDQQQAALRALEHLAGVTMPPEIGDEIRVVRTEWIYHALQVIADLRKQVETPNSEGRP